MTSKERDELLDALLDGEISEADFLRLEGEMHVDPEVRRAYYDRLKLDTGLQLEAESYGGGAMPKSVAGRLQPGTPIGWLGWAAAAVLGLLAIVLGLEIRRTNEALTDEKSDVIASGFGVVAEQAGANWGLLRGDFIPQGEIALGEGMAELEMFSGVTILVEAPAKFEVVSANLVRVMEGKFFAQIPRLAGELRFETGSGEIFDVEKELALRVDPDGSATVQAGGDAIEDQMAGQLAAQKQRWMASVKKLENESGLLAYFPMTETGNWNRQLVDHSLQKRNGTVVRSNRAMNRWGEPLGGLDFTPAGSRVRVDIPGDHESLTLMCWVKIDSLDRWYNSLFLTDGHELHEPHWQIMDDGRIFFSVKANAKGTKKLSDKHIAFSPPIWTPADSGKWMHIATVFDGKGMTTTHYVNGKQVSRDEIPLELQPEKVRIGAASIGNWSDPTRGDDPEFAVRNLNGTMDEFALFSYPLSADEVEKLYESGKP